MINRETFHWSASGVQNGAGTIAIPGNVGGALVNMYNPEYPYLRFALYTDTTITFNIQTGVDRTALTTLVTFNTNPAAWNTAYDLPAPYTGPNLQMPGPWCQFQLTWIAGVTNWTFFATFANF